MPPPLYIHRRAIIRLSSALWLATNLCTSAIGAEATTDKTQTSPVRYVWANTLIMRSQPDSKSGEITKLPAGTAVTLLPDSTPLISHKEVVMKLVADPSDPAAPAADVTLDGAWRHVQAKDKDGWVFDGYLSRYPLPSDSAAKARNQDQEPRSSYDPLFGVKSATKWYGDVDDKKGTAAYRAMLKHVKPDKDQLDRIGRLEWEYIEFRAGGTYESRTILSDGTNETRYRNLPLTFNEAMLLTHYLDEIRWASPKVTGPLTRYSGTFEPGKSLSLGVAADDNEFVGGFDTYIKCTTTTCDIGSDVAD